MRCLHLEIYGVDNTVGRCLETERNDWDEGDFFLFFIKKNREGGEGRRGRTKEKQNGAGMKLRTVVCTVLTAAYRMRTYAKKIKEALVRKSPDAYVRGRGVCTNDGTKAGCRSIDRIESTRVGFTESLSVTGGR